MVLLGINDGNDEHAAANPALMREETGLVVATLVVEEEEEEGDSESVDEEEERADLTCTSSATTTTTTTASVAVVTTAAVIGIVEAKPPTFSHKVNDVLRHRRGKCCFAIVLLGVFAVVGGIAFFATDEPSQVKPTPSNNQLPKLTTTSEPQSTISPTKAPGADIEWDAEPSTSSPSPALEEDTATIAPTPAPTSTLEGYVVSLLPLSSTLEAFQDKASPQSKAFRWLLRDLSSLNNNNNQTLLPYGEDRLRQRFALATFYYATRGVGWRFQRFWMSSAHECDWYASRERRTRSEEVCDEEDRYTRLVLVDNILLGTLPPQLGLLTRLRTLHLQGDNFFQQQEQLGGRIPTELGLLGSSLELLHLSKNGLTGSLPSELGQLTRLKTLKLLENELTGTIPEELLGHCSTDTNTTDCASTAMALEEIRLYDNQFSGPVPTQLAGLSPTLRILDWGNNRFQGTVPSELALLTTLTNLDVQGNRLTGTVPTQMGTLPALEFLKLNDNLLTGTVPTQLGILRGSLSWLLLKNNRLTGTIPTQLGGLQGVSWLLLEGNSLTGSIPTEFGRLWNVRFLGLHENELVGSVPEQVCELQDDQWWFFMIQVDCGDGAVPCDCRVCVCN